MFIDRLIPSSVTSTIIWLVALGLTKALINKYGNGLSGVPGPFLAGFTDIWRLLIVWGRRPELVHIDLHEKYGSVVRLGPRTVSVADCQAVKTIYGLNSGFTKSGFYPVQQTVANGHALQSMFNTRDERFHAKLRKAVSNAYAMSTLVNFEPLVDSTTVAFLDQLKQRYAGQSGPSGRVDLGVWLQYYAFDVIGELTFSKRLGFVDRGLDVDNIIKNLEGFLDYAAVIGQLPFLDRLLLKNPLKLWLSTYKSWNLNSPVAIFAKQRMAERQHSDNEKTSINQPTHRGPQKRDFLSRFEEAAVKDPAFISEGRVLALTVANMFAGSDTTAITMRAIFYYLLKDPSKMEKLVTELSSQSKAGNFAQDDALVKWATVRELPYLGAVINEALRCHPAVGLPLERVVPPQGIAIAGHWFRGGTVVGCSAWVLHRDEATFGARTKDFRPERWIDATPEQQARMKNALFSFGSGSRTCIGKNISLLELYKLVPAVLRTFEIELVDPDQAWVLHNAWFVKQSGLGVRLKERDEIL